MIRFIQVEGAYDGFSRDVTRWTNTQNRVGGRDFLALDPEQSRIAHEFEIDGRQYVFRSGEVDPPDDQGCGIQEATVALACIQDDVRLAVQAKREVSRLWADIEKAPYKQLFNPSTSSLRVWRAVQVLRVVEASLRELRNQLGAKQRNFVVHLNRVLLWVINQHLGVAAKADDPAEDWDALLGAARAAAKQAAPVLATAAEAQYPGYPANLAKNASECETLAAHVLVELNAGT